MTVSTAMEGSNLYFSLEMEYKYWMQMLKDILNANTGKSITYKYNE